MKRNIVIILLIAFALYFFPFLQKVPEQKKYDIEWDLIHQQQNIHEFDKKSFSFIKKTKLSEQVKELNNKQINIHGFINYTLDSILYITEMPSDLCFFCGKDHYDGAIFITQDKEEHTYKPQDYVSVSGIFEVEQNNNTIKLYIRKAKLTPEINKNDIQHHAHTHKH